MNNQVAIDCERCRKKPSGLQQYCEILVDGLSQLRDDCVVYGPYEIGGFPLKRYHHLHKLYNPVLARFPLVLITHQASRISQFRKRGKVLLTVHDLNYLHLDQVSKRSLDHFISRVRWNIDLSDHIVCISHFVKEDFLSREELFPGIGKKPISVVYNGLIYPNSDLDFKAFLPKELNGVSYILNIGEDVAKKNQQAIIEMLPYIDEDLVLLIGAIDSVYTLSLMERAKALGVQHRIHLYSRVTNEVKQALLQHATAMVHPSLAEGFGFTPVEQMYYGKPVFLSNLCSLPEVGGEHAFYFDSLHDYKAMAEQYEAGMSEYKSNWDKNKEALRKHAMRFSQKEMALRYSEIYDTLL